MKWIRFCKLALRFRCGSLLTRTSGYVAERVSHGGADKMGPLGVKQDATEHREQVV
jgi:hypothetical protein